jgi:stalled ribosome rescue protein Dom34
VNRLKPKKWYKRGYPVAVLAGLEETYVALWKVFSRVIKHEKNLTLDGTRSSPKTLYNFHESIINSLRPTLKKGVRSVILASPPRTSYAKEFIKHVRQHHAWLTQGPTKVAFSQISGTASTQSQVAALTRTRRFHELISQTTSEETENLLDLLEKQLNTSNRGDSVLFSLEEAENLILKRYKPGRPQPEYLLLTDRYLLDSREKTRLNRLMQIAQNKNVKTRVITAESATGVRLTQLGGIVCIVQLE